MIHLLYLFFLGYVLKNSFTLFSCLFRQDSYWACNYVLSALRVTLGAVSSNETTVCDAIIWLCTIWQMTYSEICDVPFMSSVCDEAIKKSDVYRDVTVYHKYRNVWSFNIGCAFLSFFLNSLFSSLKAHFRNFRKK